ncbi:MAG TPA: hypothetical protein VFK25_05110 [Candidatus Binatia bacterium]|nr:hypothetical protein [Candidatus Binatia bacterium]
MSRMIVRLLLHAFAYEHYRTPGRSRVSGLEHYIRIFLLQVMPFA